MTEHPWTGVLAVEGRRSTDGRRIARGALRWPTLPMPLRDPAGDVIGRVDEVWRDGDMIRGRGVTFAPTGEVPLAAQVKVGRWSEHPGGDETTVVLEQGDLLAVAATTRPAFPDARMGA